MSSEETQAFDGNIVIIGGGIIGVCCAYYLSQHPKWNNIKNPIYLIESYEIANAASGNAGGFIASDWHGISTLSLARLSYALHSELAKQYNGELNWGFRHVSALSLTINESGASSKHNDVKWVQASKVEHVSKLGDSPDTCQVVPREFTKFICQEAQKKGVKLIYGHVKKIEANCVHYLPRLDKDYQKPFGEVVEKLEAAKIICAAGPWTKFLLPQLPIDGEPSHSFIVDTQSEIPPECLFIEMKSNNSSCMEIEIHPRTQRIYACSNSIPRSLPEYPENVGTDSSSGEELKRTVSVILQEDISTSSAINQSCFRPVNCQKGHPIICELKKGLFVATGHSCWGICLGPGTGKIISELVLDEKPISANIRMLKMKLQ